MITDFIYPFPPLITGRLIKRYKRFFADIELETGEIITAHCPNTGPMTGVSTLFSLVQVSQQNNPKRKLKYTWETIQVNQTWVGINTALPNKIIKIMLEKRLLSNCLGEYDYIYSEVAYGKEKKSRIDFLLTSDNPLVKPIYIEIKNTTLTDGKVAVFPDTVTTRGQKHLQELMDLVPNAQPIMLYFINRSDCRQFAPGDLTDSFYSQLFREAITKGVQVLPCRFEVAPQGIRYLGIAEYLLYQPSFKPL
ncbi:DNA/RNA nuclease SfsA [Aphanothece hegewaldii CCALA 016]|uniref:Sugar fermentation stimulation protein homolog n=1 Tax=Aphanothece hegewaldii CCALA 016 TaxID=2107694 RepID=A0A2T1LS50_9CHRO|nr:DNA/RNA nuclease SfsA [Aphanothece hegewaldii]PSF32266.1 DNA/RNA nuclease SfsA [Aphanothece hegewaldii CCALA 016]